MNTPFSLFFEFHHWVVGGLVSSVRLIPIFMLLPFLNQSTVPALIRYPLVFLLGVVLHENIALSAEDSSIMFLVAIVAKELLIGLMLSVFLCFPFWVMHAVGSYIDNQRGATLSSSLSPQTGIDASELANFLNLVGVMIVLESGGMVTLLDVMFRSYLLWPLERMSFPSLDDALVFLSALISSAVRLSAPVITLFLVTELLLGLLSRYTPQLNAFSIALTVKSIIGFSVLLLYMSPVLPSEILMLEKLFLP